METHVNFAKDDKAPELITKNLESRGQISFFYSGDDFDVRPSEWEKYLHPVKLLKGNQNAYYSYITDIKNYNVDTKKIASDEKILKMH